MDQIIIDVDGSTNSQDEFTITEDASDVKVVAGVGGEQASSADTNGWYFYWVLHIILDFLNNTH